MKKLFTKFSKRIAHWVGQPLAFILAITSVLIWIILGPFNDYSDTWQLVINTGTTIVTFLMVFLIQNTQNRDGYAVQLKLDELIRATKAARNELLDLEDLSDEEMEKLHKEFCDLKEHYESSANQIHKHRQRRANRAITRK